MNIKLIGSKSSPFVRKVEIALRLLDLNYDFEIDLPWQPDSQIAKMNPVGKIPVMIIDGEMTLFDSSIIIEFLLNTVPNTALTKTSGEVKDKLLTTVVDEALNTSILYSWELKRPSGKMDESVLNKYERRIESCLHYLNNFYQIDKTTLSVLDISFICCIDYILLRQFVPISEEYYPHLLCNRRQLYTIESICATSPNKSQ